MNRTQMTVSGYLLLALAKGGLEVAAREPQKIAVRTIGTTVVAGEVDVKTLRDALEALPRTPTRIEMVDDRRLSAGTLKQIADMDAFVIEGQQTIYIRRQSRTLRAAIEDDGHWTLILSVVIWHEMAHAEGLDEAGARRREEALWRQFIRDKRVEDGIGMTYLQAL